MVVKKKEIEIYLDEENKLNITIIKKNNIFIKFAINYSAKINDKWEAIYRVDNYHDFIHEQRLWITKRPIPLPEYENWNLKDVFDLFFEKVKQGCLKFKKYYETGKK